MLDDTTTEASTPAPRCNWCSAVLPSDHEVTCPSCGATLLGDGDTSVPGLTAIDSEAILRSARAAKTKSRSRLLGWISGEYDEGPAKAAPPGSLSLPSADVRREMLRLELEAQVANAQAEVESMAADIAVEQGLPLTPMGAADAVAEADAAEPATDVAPASDGEPAAAAEAGDDAPDDNKDEAPPA